MDGNKEYKSDVFSMLLEDKKNALEVYNAVNATAFTDPELIEVIKLENGGMHLSVRNDASFILDAHLNIYEHQSTVCPNMPLRNLLYYTDIVKKLINNRDLFSSNLIRIPAPKFVVFYNGSKSQPEKQTYQLSEAYDQQPDDYELELTCTVYDINKGHNQEFLSRCQVLEDYATFVNYVRMNHKKELTKEYFEDNIRNAMDRCIEEGILADFFRNRYDEVLKNMVLDYTFERRLELAAEEYRNIGREEEHHEMLKTLVTRLRNRGMQDSEILDLLGCTEEEIKTVNECM